MVAPEHNLLHVDMRIVCVLHLRGKVLASSILKRKDVRKRNGHTNAT